MGLFGKNRTTLITNAVRNFRRAGASSNVSNLNARLNRIISDAPASKREFLRKYAQAAKRALLVTNRNRTNANRIVSNARLEVEQNRLNRRYSQLKNNVLRNRFERLKRRS